MPPVGFEPTISAGERPKSHALDFTANGTGENQLYREHNYFFKEITKCRFKPQISNLTVDIADNRCGIGIQLFISQNCQCFRLNRVDRKTPVEILIKKALEGRVIE
jgi:hypothetical protein